MRQVLGIFAFTLTLVASACSSEAETAISSFAPTPTDAWQRLDSGAFWAFHSPGDPHSPRVLSAGTGPDFNVYSHDAAVLDLLKDVDLTLKSPMRLEKIEAWEIYYQKDLRAGLADTTLNGVPAVLFVTVSQSENSPQYGLFAILMAQDTYFDWGGASWLMMENGLIGDHKIYSKERRAQIARAPYDTQLQLFEAAADIRIKALIDGLSQQMALQSMIDLNLDLMFGDLAVSSSGE